MNRSPDLPDSQQFVASTGEASASTSVSSPGTAASSTRSNLSQRFRALKDALMRWPRPRPASYRVPSWYSNVTIMKRIDEVILVANENDRYGEPYTFEELDADGRWALHVAGEHERRHAIVRAMFGTRLSGKHVSPARNEPSVEARPSSSHGHNGVTERNDENDRGPRSFFDTTDWDNVENDSSDDEAVETETPDAERERIFQLFEDVPTCIQKARHLPPIDSDDHGIMIISNRESGWKHIDPAQLPPRIKKYLAQFTRLDAAAFPDGPSSKLSGDSHRWLLATPHKEFICDTSTLDELAAGSAQRKRQLIQDLRKFQDPQGPQMRCRSKVGVNRRLAKGPRPLPRCSWNFCGEPDDTNRGPQIIVTEPSGASHYLMEPDTFRLKVSQHWQHCSTQAASYTEKMRRTHRMEDMASFINEEMETYGSDELDPFHLHTSDHGTRWWLRLGKLLFRSGVQPQALLPLYHTHSTSEDPEKPKLFGYDGAQDGHAREEKAGMLRLPGFVGNLRDLACCFSKL
ncbi:hypothetical protein diail_5164 [Diaporthe ilicicola]|nr:hypothetical protein diail_5164 [Diaporthe ilicicola]